MPRTEGERMLRERKNRSRLSLDTMARDIGVTRAGVHKWLFGETRPGPSSRSAIFGRYEIPVDAWDVACDGAAFTKGGGADVTYPRPPPPAAPAPAPVAPDSTSQSLTVAAGPPPSSLDDCLAVLAQIRKQRNRDDIVASERVKLATSEVRLLQLRARLERDAERSEARIVYEHPTWKRMRHLIRVTLAKHPDALKDLVRALGEAMADTTTSTTNGETTPP